MRRLYPAIVFAVLLLSSAAPAQEGGPGSGWGEETRYLGTRELPRPVWMAIISDDKGTLVLAGAGEAIFHEGESQPVGIVQAVSPVDLTLTLSRDGRTVRIFPGRPIPDTRHLRLHDVLRVKTLEYRHRPVLRGRRKILGGELYLVALRGTHAVLLRDVEPAPSPAESLEQRLAAIRIVEVAPHVWEVNTGDIQKAMESGEAILRQALDESWVNFSRGHGIGLELKTPLADVRVDRRGFEVTSPNLAGRIGLETGDRILGVNGLPIDGLGDLARAYRSIKNDPTVRSVALTIERREKPLSLTYRIR